MQNELALAQRVLTEGKPFNVAWVDEGNCESGPSGGLRSGVRWGQVALEVSRNGSCYLVRYSRDFYPVTYRCVYGTHLGSGHWGGTGPQDFWVDKERQAVRDQVVALAKAVR